jgi:serine/threonine protein kinase
VDIANGMNLIHQKGIVHFDLKPANVLAEVVNGHWSYVICDFGFANFLSDVQDKIVKGVKKPSAIGITARFAAPELFAKVNMVNLASSLNMVNLASSLNAEEIEKKIDVYAYAMTLFYVYTREAPWKDLSIDVIERLAIAGERPEIPSTKFDIPKKIEGLIKVCWSNDPNGRPSFAEILEILAQCQ